MISNVKWVKDLYGFKPLSDQVVSLNRVFIPIVTSGGYALNEQLCPSKLNSLGNLNASGPWGYNRKKTRFIEITWSDKAKYIWSSGLIEPCIYSYCNLRGFCQYMTSDSMSKASKYYNTEFTAQPIPPTHTVRALTGKEKAMAFHRVIK